MKCDTRLKSVKVIFAEEMQNKINKQKYNFLKY